jgi:DNA-binding MarR family transcriptional regulator
LKHPRSSAFLLAQIGAHAASMFAERLRAMDLSPPHAGILRTVAANAGISQQQLASLLNMVPSRLVSWLDELERRGLLVRRDHPEDRRVYSLHVTEKGTKAMMDIGRVAMAHDDAMCAALSPAEREQLGNLLRKIAEDQRLITGVHPGFAQLGDAKATAKAVPPDRPKPRRSPLQGRSTRSRAQKE